MPPDVAVNTARSAAVQRTYEWMDRVEESVRTAHAALLSPHPGSLRGFISAMESALREKAGLAATPSMAARLKSLEERMKLVRTMLRQAAALEQWREQSQTERILGYQPGGVERAL
jgi:hypothetical protein